MGDDSYVSVDRPSTLREFNMASTYQILGVSRCVSTSLSYLNKVPKCSALVSLRCTLPTCIRIKLTHGGACFPALPAEAPT